MQVQVLKIAFKLFTNDDVICIQATEYQLLIMFYL